MQPVVAPPVPERVRTLAAAAAPTHVSLAGSDRPAMPARGGVDGAGRPVLLVLPDEPLYDMRDEPVVTVDLTSNRLLGERELSRGLLKVQGWLQAVPEREARETAVAIAERCPDEALFTALESTGGARLLRVDIGQVVHITATESGILDAEEYLDAAPDPLLGEAERMLHHVNNAHREQLRRAVGFLLSAPAPDAWLWELDRFGATIRCDIDDPTLVRLPWPTPAGDVATLEHALHCLLCHR
ncbi:hypothetical protein FHS43_001461 [Streptosporangium becharense]|uniref:DUF2470 domain-containing protein n=1 Tax=Streptosporangium becharense TaxID=1816182 RepID=A0A7W9MJQ0_9ACTN|nr:DUF2470 domain-containing protein [Streptosporangium becharense]MBB2910198.1 hypothetical protein [Streptosporangium becharense]MBB5822941.1 hypothetical protein [Streptosporangium becharense]